MNFFILVTFSVFLLVGCASSDKIERREPSSTNRLSIGDKIDVPGWKWVDTLDSKTGLKNTGPYATCGIKFHGKLEVLDIEKQLAKVRYVYKGTTGGTPCESGIIFKILITELETFQSLFESKLHHKKQINDLTNDLLTGKSGYPSSVGKLRIAQKIPIPAWQWVNIVNSVTNQYSNGSSKLDIGDKCGLQFGGLLQIIGFSKNQKVALVKNIPTPDNLGTPCPEGALTFLTTDELSKFETEFNKRKDSEESTRKEVNLILNGESRITSKNGISLGATYKVKKWGWVTLLKSTQVQYSNGTSTSDFGDSCGTEKGGTLKVLGFLEVDNKVLVTYSAPNKPSGTPCPSNAVFAVPINSLGKVYRKTFLGF